MTSQSILQKFRVSDEQVSKAHRVENLTLHSIFYQVESSQDNGTEYTVYYHQVLQHLVCNCLAGQQGTPCWHKRAALAHTAEFVQERNERNEREMAELQQEIDNESREYTVQVSETSSSLDGVTFEVRDGKSIPMR